MATEVIFLRVPPETKAVLQATVDGMNKSRQWGEPEHTMTSVILRCINDQLAPAPAVERRAPKRKAVRK